jgi:hypothetical protein
MAVVLDHFLRGHFAPADHRPDLLAHLAGAASPDPILLPVEDGMGDALTKNRTDIA